MKEEPTRDGSIRWMSWVLGGSTNVQRGADDPVAGVRFVFRHSKFKFYKFYKISFAYLYHTFPKSF